MIDGFYVVDVPPASGKGGFYVGMEVRFGLVHETAPILRWALKKRGNVVSTWVRSKGGTVVLAGAQQSLTP